MHWYYKHILSNIQFVYLSLDINECLVDNGGCHHVCINTAGSYICQCDNGYTSVNNGVDCTGKYLVYIFDI